jgi:hypothetical protein
METEIASTKLVLMNLLNLQAGATGRRPQQPPEKLKQGITSPATTSIKLTGVRKDLERPEASHNFYFDTFKELSILLGFNPS